MSSFYFNFGALTLLALYSSRVVIFDVVPSDPKARFTKLCFLSFNLTPGHYSALNGFYLRGSCVYLKYDRTGVVWDFVQGRYCVLPFKALNEQTRPLAVRSLTDSSLTRLIFPP